MDDSDEVRMDKENKQKVNQVTMIFPHDRKLEIVPTKRYSPLG